MIALTIGKVRRLCQKFGEQVSGELPERKCNSRTRFISKPTNNVGIVGALQPFVL
ncbi:hypothetical protein [Trichodesmium erythraeum]|uniref:hypothetical protein n=1 Tax=Trichodesmium erythraeum TaxID=1206 RepID=UPI00003C9CD6